MERFIPILCWQNCHQKNKHTNDCLVVWNILYFPYIGNVIIPIDELIFFRGVAQPPTRISFTVINGISIVYTIDEVGGSTTE